MKVVVPGCEVCGSRREVICTGGRHGEMERTLCAACYADRGTIPMGRGVYEKIAEWDREHPARAGGVQPEQREFNW